MNIEHTTILTIEEMVTFLKGEHKLGAGLILTVTKCF
jgi:hypothetical protein